MFEVGFSELVLIFGISLIALGPGRLPGLVRKIGLWIGKARGMARQFGEQLDNEIHLDELSRMTHLRVNEATAQELSTPPPPPPPEVSATSSPGAANGSTAGQATGITDIVIQERA